MDFFKTLIVDDNPNIRQLLINTLSILFPTMVIEEAADGKEALQKVEALLPNLIFMDIQMPGENGLELTRKIKTNYPEIIVIILTGCDLPDYREAACRNGANYFVVKDSFAIEQIEKLVKSILSDLGYNESCSKLALNKEKGY